MVYYGSFPKVSGVVSTHDIFHTNDPKFVIEKVVIRYLETNNVNHFTVSPEMGRNAYLGVNKLCYQLGFDPSMRFIHKTL